MTPLYNSGPHLHNIMLFLTLLNSLDNIPCFSSSVMKKYFTVVHYDGMPLNVGTFPRQEQGITFFDGVVPPIQLEEMKELHQEGNAAVHKFLSEKCSWISEVKEFDICDASGTVHVNVFTKFASANGDADSVKEDLQEVFESLEACSNCILSGHSKECSFPSLNDVCNRCASLNLENSPCISARCIHVSSDQASAQRKAHLDMNAIANTDILKPDYRFFGFGLLHFCKNCISSLRHYRLTNMSGTFFVALLTSVWASNTPEAREMKATTPATVFSYRDAHSDEIGFQTVSKPLEDIVRKTGSIVTTLIPEQYKPTALEAKTHSLLGRPLYITRNANGDILWTDAEYEFIGMGNRHIPTKCVALGIWDNPGPAHESPVLPSKAQFRHPAGIDVMIIEPGKKEVAFVCDKGNGCIRVIHGVQSFNAPKVIATLKLSANLSTDPWKPEGLAVVGSNTLAITEGRSLCLVQVEDTYTAGQVCQVIIDGFESPHGLCSSVDDNTVLVADGHSVKQVNLETKSVSVIHQGCKKAFDVAVSSKGCVAVTDVQAHKIKILAKDDDGTYSIQEVVGRGTPGYTDGPAQQAELSEPTGVCFDFETVIFCCFGGAKQGYIKLHTNVDFACNFMSAVRDIYLSTGFMPKKEQNKHAQLGNRPRVSFTDGTDKLVNSLCYLEKLVEDRKEYLNMCTAGPEGTVYHLSVQGFAETVRSLEAHIQSLELINRKDILTLFNLYAFVNESRKEHGFAKHKQSGQYRHPTKEQYVRTKGHHEIELIKKTCRCPHAYHTNSYSAYQPTHSCDLSSTATVAQYKKWASKFSPPSNQPSQESRQELKVARMLNVLTKSRPTQNVRDLYRYKCGYSPCVIFQKDVILQDHGQPYQHHYATFEESMKNLEVLRATSAVGRSEEYIFVPGDIVVVNPGTHNELPTGDKWWLLQINKAHPASKNRSGCHVFGFWLDEVESQETTVSGKTFGLLANPVKIYYGSIVKESNSPVVIPMEKLTSGWQNGTVTYAFQNEYCCYLDETSDSFRKHLGLEVNESNAESENDSHSDSDSDSETDTQNEQLHQVEIEAIHRRRRVVRNPEGQILTSYNDLSNPNNRRKCQRRLRNCALEPSEHEAERNNPEF